MISTGFKLVCCKMTGHVFLFVFVWINRHAGTNTGSLSQYLLRLTTTGQNKWIKGELVKALFKENVFILSHATCSCRIAAIESIVSCVEDFNFVCMPIK